MTPNQRSRCVCGYPIQTIKETDIPCPICNREYDPETGEQRANWAWKRVDGEFVSTKGTDLQVAVERQRRIANGENASTVYTGRWEELDDVCDMTVIRDAYLAEHPTDDETPITLEWLQSAGGAMTHRGYGRYLSFGDLVAAWYDRDDIRYGRSLEEAEWTCDRIVIPSPKTRGDVRRLCMALGIQLKEQA